MSSFDFLAELRYTLPPLEIHTLVSRLKADPILWASLADEISFRQASQAAKGIFKNWSPANLSLAAIQPDLTPEAFVGDLSTGPEDRLLQASLKLFQETRRTGRVPRTLAEAGLLALALRQHWKLEHSWKGLSYQLAPAGSEPDWKHFKIWRSALACLYGMVPDPLDMLRGLISKRYSPVCTAWVIHTLTSNPLSDLELTQSLFNLAVGLSPLQQIAWLRFVKSLGYDSIVETLARQILTRVPPAVAASLASVDFSGQDLESLLLRFLEMQRLAGLYRLANQPANARTLIHRSHTVLNFWEAGLNLQDVELSALAGEAAGSDVEDQLSEQMLAHEDLQQELAFIQNQHAVPDMDGLLSDSSQSPFVQIKKSASLHQQGKTSQAISLARSAFERLSNVLQEVPYFFLPTFVFDWHPRQFIEVYFALGLVDEGLQLAEIFLSIRQEDLEIQEMVSVTFEQCGNLEKALDGAQLMTAFAPERLDLSRRLSSLYARLENWPAAFRERKAVLDLANPPVAEDWLAFAFAASKTDNWDDVQQAAENALQLNPESGLAYALIGQVKQRQGKKEEAGRLFIQSTLLSPDEVYGWLCLASYHEQNGAIDKSLEVMRAAVLSIPDSAEINFTLAKACIKQGYLADSLPHLRKAVEMAPDSMDAALEFGKTLFTLGRLDEAENILRRAHHKWPKEFDLAYAYARAALSVGEQKNALLALEIAIQKENAPADWLILHAETLLWDFPCSWPEPVYPHAGLVLARQVLEKAIAQEGNNFKAHLLLAEVKMAQGLLQQASEEYNHLAEFPEAATHGYRWRLQAGIGHLALKQGLVANALAALQEAVQDQPQNVGLHRLLSEAYQAGELSEDAVRVARQALKLAPDDLVNLSWFADVMIQLKQPAEALHALNCATQLDPTLPSFWLRLGRLQAEAGDTASAVSSLEKMLILPGLTATDFRSAAKTFLIVNQVTRSLECLKRALVETQSAGVQTLIEAAYLSQKLGSAEQGLELLQKALVASPDDPALYCFQADLLVELKRAEAALACLEHSQQLAGLSKPGKPVYWISNPEEILTGAWVARITDPAGMHFRMACLYRQAGNPSAAFQHFQAAYEIHPQWLSIKILAADMANALLLPEQAADFSCSTAGMEDPLADFLPCFQGEADLWAIRAELAMEGGSEDTLELITEGLKIKPDSARLLAVRARLEYSQGHLAPALADFRKAALVISSSVKNNKSGSYEGPNPCYWLLKAAIETWQWAEAAQLAGLLVKEHPNEPASHLLYARALAFAAETQRLMGELQALSCLPGEASLSDASNDLFEKSIQNAGRLGSSAEIELWKMIGRAAFRPTSQNLRSLASLLPSARAAKSLTAALRQTSNLAGAIQVAEQYPDDREVQVQLALSYLQMDARKGLELVRDIAEKRPWDVIANIVMAILARQQGELYQSLSALQNALVAWPMEGIWQAWAGEIAARLGEKGYAVAHWEQAAGLHPDHFPYALALGGAYLVNDQAPQAIKILENAMQSNPNRADGWHLLAQAYRLDGNFSEALRCARQTSELEPSFVQPLLLCGEICLDMGKKQEALVFAQKSWGLEPENTAVLQFFTQVLVQEGKQEEALKILDRISVAAMVLPVAILRVRLVKELRGPLEAFGILQKLSVQYPNNLDILALLALVQAENGDEAGAEKTAVQALTLQPENPKLNMLVGKIHKKAGNLDKAVYFFSCAIRQDPTCLDNYLDLAGIYLDRREPQLALKTFQKAIMVDPFDHRAYLLAAQVLKEGHDYISAESMLRKAVELLPDDVNIRRQLGAVITLNLIHNSQEAMTSHESFRTREPK
jgi:tetratricopeptide (TPR) repeat protein